MVNENLRMLRRDAACFLSTVDVGTAAREGLSLWSDLATHCAALWWHRAGEMQPKGHGNISVGAQGCQRQHALEICAADMSDLDGCVTASEQGSHTGKSERFSARA